MILPETVWDFILSEFKALQPPANRGGGSVRIAFELHYAEGPTLHAVDVDTGLRTKLRLGVANNGKSG